MKSLKLVVLLIAVLVGKISSAQQVLTDVFDPQVLKQLDQPGRFSLATVLSELGGKEEQLEKSLIQKLPAESRLRIIRLDELSKERNSRLFHSLQTKIQSDIQGIVKEIVGNTTMKTVSRSVVQAYKDNSTGDIARHFDWEWLTSKFSAFPLIGVINRIDRRDFSQTGCGELRFIYRLAYEVSKEDYSTFPVFLNVVYEYQGSQCAAIANDWVSRGITPDQTENMTNWLLNGALRRGGQIKLKQIELNMQAVRFPSGLETKLGGQAIYLLRIFQPKSGKLVAIPLENTPDVAKILSKPNLMDALLAQLNDPRNLGKIDDGTFVLENTGNELLATIALSYSTTGRARLANKPFSVLFAKKENLDKLKLNSGAKFIANKAGLLERLNNNTCTGCHQSNGTAGFHVLGGPNEYSPAFSRVVLPFSPHYYAEQTRRRVYTETLVRDGEPNAFRPHSFFPQATWSAAGIPSFSSARLKDICIKAGSFSKGINCDGGAVCKVNVTNEKNAVQFGECTLPDNAPVASLFAGLTCRGGEIQESTLAMTDKIVSAFGEQQAELATAFNSKSFKDSISGPTKFYANLPEERCGKPVGGVPLGRISKKCDEDLDAQRLKPLDNYLNSSNNAGEYPAEFCAIRGGSYFDECAKKCDPVKCLADAKPARSMLDLCGMGRFCREDYICQQFPEEIADQFEHEGKADLKKRIVKLHQKQIGFCTPNYFVFNMRVDGRVLPGTSGCPNVK